MPGLLSQNAQAVLSETDLTVSILPLGFTMAWVRGLGYEAYPGASLIMAANQCTNGVSLGTEPSSIKELDTLQRSTGGGINWHQIWPRHRLSADNEGVCFWRATRWRSETPPSVLRVRREVLKPNFHGVLGSVSQMSLDQR
nr:hypothetical protein CFP56_30667 [Quercus suber]